MSKTEKIYHIYHDAWLPDPKFPVPSIEKYDEKKEWCKSHRHFLCHVKRPRNRAMLSSLWDDWVWLPSFMGSRYVVVAKDGGAPVLARSSGSERDGRVCSDCWKVVEEMRAVLPEDACLPAADFCHRRLKHLRVPPDATPEQKLQILWRDCHNISWMLWLLTGRLSATPPCSEGRLKYARWVWTSASCSQLGHVPTSPVVSSDLEWRHKLTGYLLKPKTKPEAYRGLRGEYGIEMTGPGVDVVDIMCSRAIPSAGPHNPGNLEDWSVDHCRSLRAQFPEVPEVYVEKTKGRK